MIKIHENHVSLALFSLCYFYALSFVWRQTDETTSETSYWLYNMFCILLIQLSVKFCIDQACHF
jgi:hypothetical protein